MARNCFVPLALLGGLFSFIVIHAICVTALALASRGKDRDKQASAAGQDVNRPSVSESASDFAAAF